MAEVGQIATMPTFAIVGIIVIGVVTVLPLGAAILFIGLWTGRVQTTANNAEKTAEVARERAHDLANQLTAFKVEASQEFVRQGALDKLESRLMDGMNEVRKSIERLFSGDHHRPPST